MKLNLGYLVLFTVVASSISSIVFQEKANAWVDICNKGSTRIEKLAVAYTVPIGDDHFDWMSTGTDRFSMNPGECKRVYDQDLEDSKKPFFYHVEGAGWGNSDRGKKFCIATDKDFQFYEHGKALENGCGGVKTVRITRCTGTCDTTTTTYNTKVANFNIFMTSGRNFTLNLTN